jgi:hypothetical protein
MLPQSFHCVNVLSNITPDPRGQTASFHMHVPFFEFAPDSSFTLSLKSAQPTNASAPTIVEAPTDRGHINLLDLQLLFDGSQFGFTQEETTVSLPVFVGASITFELIISHKEKKLNLACLMKTIGLFTRILKARDHTNISCQNIIGSTDF